MQTEKRQQKQSESKLALQNAFQRRHILPAIQAVVPRRILRIEGFVSNIFLALVDRFDHFCSPLVQRVPFCISCARGLSSPQNYLFEA